MQMFDICVSIWLHSLLLENKPKHTATGTTNLHKAAGKQIHLNQAQTSRTLQKWNEEVFVNLYF